jgi:hypothetical protein
MNTSVGKGRQDNWQSPMDTFPCRGRTGRTGRTNRTHRTNGTNRISRADTRDPRRFVRPCDFGHIGPRWNLARLPVIRKSNGSGPACR